MYLRKNAKTVFLTLCLICGFITSGHAMNNKESQPPSSVGSANYYELKPNEYFVSLGVKGYQQTDNYTCGPSAVMSLLRWYNILNDSDMNSATEMRIAKEMGTGIQGSAQPGTMGPAIVEWLQKNGFDATLGTNGTLEMLRDNMKKGIPTIVEWSDWGGHWVVATGYYAGSETPQKGLDTIFFADSGTHWTSVNNPDGITSFNANRFYYMWYDALYSEHIIKGGYITATPHKKDN
jgi:hypothetical protein